MKGIILAGGTGSRLRPITHTGPKQLVPVANKPVLQYGIEDLRDAGITDIGVVLGNKGRTEIQEFLGNGSGFGVNITYIIQGEPLGLAHAVGCAQKFVGDEDFVVYLGDNLMNQKLTGFVEVFESKSADAGIALQKVSNPSQFGIADTDETGNINKLVEKPENPPSSLALIGIYIFSSRIFSAIREITPSWRGELEITDAIQHLIDSNCTVTSHVVEGWWKDTGKPEDILDANRLVLEDLSDDRRGTIDSGAEVEGQVELVESAEIKGDVVVRGPVSIGRDTTIESGTYIGPYTSIGPGSLISGAHIENSVLIGENAVTTDEKIVDSLIGQDAKIQSAEGLLPTGNRFVVGENSTVRL